MSERPVTPADRWSSGPAYESFIGRWSRLVARAFLRWLDLPTGCRWLDVGSGTGALTEAVLASCAPAEVVGIEPSAAFREHAAVVVTDRRASFRAGDANSLPVEDAAFDAVVSGLVLNFVPDRPTAMAEMRRVARPGGTVATYVWDYAAGMTLLTTFWDAAVSLAPAAAAWDERARFEGSRPDPLRALFTRAGLHGVELEGIVVPLDFAGFDDYWAPFLRGTGPAAAYAATLDDAGRAALEDALRARLPTDDDGSIHLAARAWAVRGTV